MPKRVTPLTGTQLKNARPKAKAGILADGGAMPISATQARAVLAALQKIEARRVVGGAAIAPCLHHRAQ